MALVDLTVARPPVVDTANQTIATIAALRTTEPSSDGQRAIILEHTAGTGKGGGGFRALLNGASYTDNNGTIIKTTGGAVWLRLQADIVNPLMFGAVADGVTSDTTAINAALAAAPRICDGAGLSYGIGSTVLQIQTVPTTFRDAKLVYLTSLGTSPMMRRRHAAHVTTGINFEGAGSTTSVGIIWEGASQVLSTGVVGGAIENCGFKSIGGSAISVSADYTNLWFASYGAVRNCSFINCGRIGTGTNSATVLSNGVNSFTFEGLNLTGCNWGIYVRNDLDTAGVTRASGNSIGNCIIRGSTTMFTAAQGISASFQSGLRVHDVVVSDFDDNAIDMQYCDYSRVSDYTAINCKDAVFMGDRSCKGHVISNGTAIDCQRGVRCITDGTIDASAVIQDISLQNLHVFNPKYHGFYIGRVGSGTSLSNVTVDNCSVDAPGSYTLSTLVTGLHIQGATNVKVSNFNSRSLRSTSVLIQDSELVQILGGVHQDADRAGTGAYAVTVSTGCNRCTIGDVHVYGSGTAGAVLLTAGAGHSVKDTRWRSVANGVSSSGATSPYLLNNTSF